MLIEEQKQIITQRANLELGEATSKFWREVEQAERMGASHGRTNSSATFQKQEDLAFEFVNKHAERVWEIAYRVLTTTGVSYSSELSGELKQLLDSLLHRGAPDLSSHWGRRFGRGQMAQATEYKTRLQGRRDHALAKIGTEIELFVYSLKTKQQSAKGGPIPTEYHFYSPVGAVQTGPDATANVTQNVVDPEGQRQLLEILARLESILQNTPDVSQERKEELVEIVEENKTELQKERPSLLRMGGNVLALTKLLAKLPGAYQEIKTALEFWLQQMM